MIIQQVHKIILRQAAFIVSIMEQLTAKRKPTERDVQGYHGHSHLLSGVSKLQLETRLFFEILFKMGDMLY